MDTSDYDNLKSQFISNYPDSEDKWPYLSAALYQENLKNVLDNSKTNFGTLSEATVTLNSYIEKKPIIDVDKAILNNEMSQNVLNEFLKVIDKYSVITENNIKDIFKSVAAGTNTKGKDLYMPIRLSLTGTHDGLELNKQIPNMTKEDIKKNINEELL